MRSRLLLPLLPAAAVLALAAPAGAADINVTIKTDPVVDGCQVNGCSLREAVIQANANADPGNRILLPDLDGDFRISLDGAGEDQATTGDLDIRKDLTIEGQGQLVTQIDGSSKDRLFDVGAGATNASLTLRSVAAFSGRTKEAAGGGLILVRSGGALTTDRAWLGNGSTDGPGIDGGVIAASGPVTLRDSAVTNGYAEDEGGGIAMLAPVPLTLERSAINQAGAGGNGSAIATVTGAPVTMARRSITLGDLNDDARGALYLRGGGSITDSTIALNTSPLVTNPGGLVAEAPVALRNSVVALNLAEKIEGPSLNCAGPIVSLGHNFEDADTCALRTTGDQPDGGNPRLELPDFFGSSKAKKRLTEDELFDASLSLHPLGGSPLIDAGADCDALDQRGLARPQHGRCDIGAVEAEFVAGRPIAPPAPPAAAPAPAPAVATPRAVAKLIARPALSKLGVSSRNGRASVRVTLDRAAQLEARITTKPRRGKAKKVATLRKAGKRGVNTLSRKLKPGRYQVAVTATVDGTTSIVARKTFTVKKAGR